MASVVYHSYNQIRAEGQVKLFRSHRPGFADGEQRRDFIYVEDIARVMLLDHGKNGGRTNGGRTFLKVMGYITWGRARPEVLMTW